MFGFSGPTIGLAEEVGMADEEAFAVVVGVDEPVGDGAGAVAAADLVCGHEKKKDHAFKTDRERRHLS